MSEWSRFKRRLLWRHPVTAFYYWRARLRRQGDD